mmetsp:Transcript_15381/g.36570  ORF Transcript_15381/g.36570 Transcript_15381/m.36570 type:complete len:195 (-) Transcript_15381:209-793(-)
MRRSVLSMLWQLVWVCVLLVLLVCEAIEIHVDLNASQKKCYGEELGKGTLLIAEFVTTDGLLSVNVADPSATIFSEKDKMEIKTAFTTNQAGTHMFCVQNLSRKGINVKLNIAWGAQARDYSSIAKKRTPRTDDGVFEEDRGGVASVPQHHPVHAREGAGPEEDQRQYRLPRHRVHSLQRRTHGRRVRSADLLL